jgi:hypothetical protein
MTPAADRHRDLDRAAATAMGEAPGHGLLPSRHRGRDSRSLNAEAKVLIAELVEHTSARGTRYLRGWLGASNLVAFAGKPDAEGRATWKLYLAERQPRPGTPT